MIRVCHLCHRCYWRYRDEHPPRPFCSLPCKEMWLAEKRAGIEDVPGIPAAILQLMKSHRLIIHGTDSALAWFDCDECDRLEVLYGESLQYHYTQITAAIAQAAQGSQA